MKDVLTRLELQENWVNLVKHGKIILSPKFEGLSIAVQAIKP